MALPTCNEDMNIISKLDDEPNDVGGLSAASLKAKFDLAGNLLKKALNDLVAALGGESAAKCIGFVATEAVNKTNVQEAIENVQAQIADVTQGGIADGAVTTDKLAGGAVTTEKIANGAVTYYQIANETIGSPELANNAVAASKIASSAVQERHIFNGAVTESKLAGESVTQAKIATAAVTSNKIAMRAVTPEKLAQSAVTTEKIATGAVTGEKVSYKALVTNADLSTEVISSGKVCSVSTAVFRHMRAIGMMFCSLYMTGLAEADVGHDIVVGFSGGEAYQRPGTDAGADGMLRDPAASVLTARIVYKDVQGWDVWVDSPSVRFNSGGQLVVPIPEGVRASGNCKIYVSGWYMA